MCRSPGAHHGPARPSRAEVGADLPVFVAGDFNNGPASATAAFMRDAFLAPTPAAGSPGGGLASAFGGPAGTDEPCFTSYNYRRQWTIDYIFHSRHIPCGRGRGPFFIYYLLFIIIFI